MPRPPAPFARLAALLALVSSVLTACSAPDVPRTVTFDAADYPRVFELTQETIRDYRFEFARVDARNGIIATELKPSAGLATPYDREQQTLGQEWQDLVNDQLREVRVWFRAVPGPGEPAPAPGTSPGPALRTDRDLRRIDGSIEATVEVTIHRRRNPGSQVETENIAASNSWASPQLRSRGIYRGMTTPLRRDDDLARAIIDDVTEAMTAQK